MKTDKKPVIGFICVMLCCILTMGITIGLLHSVNGSNAATGSTADTTGAPTDTPKDSVDEPPAGEPELQWGYKFKYFNGAVDGGRIGSVAYKSQKNTFNIDDVTLTVSYGELGAKLGPNMYYDVPEFDIYFADPLDYPTVSIHTLKTVKEQFFSEKYNITFVDDRPNNMYYYEYAHSEEITIPKELFTESEGLICLMIGGTNVAENNKYLDEYKILGGADIKYQLTGTGEVILSKPYEDDWHY